MFRKMSLALLASASCLAWSLGFADQAFAFDRSPLVEPSVIYAQQAAVRTAYAERSQMGGGFIEFLFGDGLQQSGRYQQQPVYQQQPDYYGARRAPYPPMDPQQSMRPQYEASDPAQRPFDPKYEKQLVEYHGK
jgi:hypothetical protein